MPALGVKPDCEYHVHISKHRQHNEVLTLTPEDVLPPSMPHPRIPSLISDEEIKERVAAF